MRSRAPTATLLVAAALVACQQTAPQTAGTPPDRDGRTATPRIEPQADLPAPPDTDRGLTLRPVDPLSLEDLPGSRPLTVGRAEAWDVAVMSASRTAATVVHPSTHEARGWLTLIDLDRWDVHVTDMHLWSTGLQPDPDGEALWWLDQHAVVRHWQPGAATTTDVPLPDGLWSASVTPLGGGRAGVYAQALTDASESVGPPRVVLVESGAIIADTALGGVAESRTQVDDGFHVMAAALAWDTEQARLYVVDPESWAVTVVDLGTGEVVSSRPTVLQRIAAWLVPPAQAKALHGVQLTATLSPAGDRLYVTGTRDESPIGIRVFDTATLEEVTRGSLSVESVTLAPDGSRLFAQALTGDAGLLVIDPQTLGVADRLPVEGWLAGLSPGGEHVYVGAHRSEREWTQVVDLATGEVIAEREGRYLPEAGVLATWTVP